MRKVGFFRKKTSSPPVLLGNILILKTAYSTSSGCIQNHCHLTFLMGVPHVVFGC